MTVITKCPRLIAAVVTVTIVVPALVLARKTLIT